MAAAINLPTHLGTEGDLCTHVNPQTNKAKTSKSHPRKAKASKSRCTALQHELFAQCIFHHPLVYTLSFIKNRQQTSRSIIYSLKMKQKLGIQS